MKCSRTRLVALTFAPFALVTNVAHGAPRAEPAKLVYERAPSASECPDEATFRAAVAARLGYDPFAEGASRQVRVSLSRAAERYRGRVLLEAAGGETAGEREIEARACGELVSALSATAAMGIDPFAAGPSGAIDPAGALPPSEPAGGAERDPPFDSRAHATSDGSQNAAPLADAPVRPTLPSRGARNDHPTRVRVGGGALASFGTAPSTAGGGVAFVELAKRRLSIALEGRADLPSSAPARRGEAVAALVVGQLVPCALVGAVFLCGVFSGGAIRGEGRSIERPTKASGPYAAVGVRSGAELSVTRALGLRAFVEASAPLTRVTLRIDDQDVFTTPTVVFALGTSVVITLP
jgi:hypothetical protein